MSTRPDGQRRDPTLFLHDGDHDEMACARLLIDARERIRKVFDPDLFGDPTFDILLHLFTAQRSGIRTTITGLADIAHVPPTTALRYGTLLEKRGIVERYGHPHDRRVVLIRLTQEGQDRMRAYLSGIAKR